MSDLDAFQIEEVDDIEQRVVLIGQHLSQLDELTVQANASAATVDLTDNRLESGVSFDQFTALRTLILDKNFLDEFPADFPVLQSVETLWINNNAFSDLAALMDQLCRLFPNLAYLSMLKNPACPDMYSDGSNIDAHRRYRLLVIHKLPKLRSLDATEVSADERAEAERTGRFLQVARPDASQYAQSGKRESLIDPQLRTEPESQQNNRAPPASYLVRTGRGRARYDGRHSEGNRFIMNDDL